MMSSQTEASGKSSSIIRAEPALLRRLNEEKVIGALKEGGALTRAQIVRRTELSHPTVSKIVDVLLAASMLEEGELKRPDLGRPSKTVALASKASRVFSLVIGVHRCSLVAAGLDGKSQTSKVEIFATPESYVDLLDRVEQLIYNYAERESIRILGLGVCLPGLLGAKDEKVILCPNLHWLEGRRPCRDLEQRMGFPAVMIPAMAAHYMFESRYGAAQALDDFVVVNYAGGLGVAVSNGGRLVDGVGGLAGELGHITVDLEGELCGCGNRGCLETVASDRAVLNAVSKRVGEALTFSELIGRVQASNGEFDDILERSARYLAIGLAAAVNIFNPSAIFIYGKFLAAQEGLFEKVVNWTQQRALKLSADQCSIYQPSRDPHECQQFGAAAAIIEKLTRSASRHRIELEQNHVA